MKPTFTLGRIMGIPIGINWSWFIVFFLITAILAQYILPTLEEGWGTALYWVAGAVTCLIFFASLLVHELAHSVVAVRRGVEVKSITLFILGGAARIAREAASPRTELMMAVAGPLSSLLQAGLFAVVWLLAEDSVSWLAAIAFYLCWINIAVAVFNMLPGFPMDGGRVLRSALWWGSGDYRRATRLATRVGQALGILIVLGGIAIGVLYYWFSGFWTAFIGIFLFVAATTSFRQMMLRERLREMTARDLMAADCPAVPGTLPVSELVGEHAPSAGNRCLLVGEPQSVKGVVTELDVRLMPRKRRALATAADAMTPVEKLGVVSPDTEGLTVLEIMEETGAMALLVVSVGTVTGVIERARILRLAKGGPEGA